MEPSAEPGNALFRFLPSCGLKKTLRRSKAGILATGTMTRLPSSREISMFFRNSCTAMMGGYSYPWIPAITVKTGPSFLPLISVTGNETWLPCRSERGIFRSWRAEKGIVLRVFRREVCAVTVTVMSSRKPVKKSLVMKKGNVSLKERTVSLIFF